MALQSGLSALGVRKVCSKVWRLREVCSLRGGRRLWPVLTCAREVLTVSASG